MTPTLHRLAALLALFAFPSAVFAHRLDEYLQATLVAIEPSGVRLQINLTTGVAVAEQVLALIDRNRDGTISPHEAATYAEALKRDLTLRLDGRKLALKLTGSEFPAPAALRSGWGIIQVEFSATPEPLASGAHRLALENRHLTTVSVYLLNAAQPRSGTVQITRQKRNNTQSTGEIAFTIHPAACHYPAPSQCETCSAHSYGTAMLPSFVASSPFPTNSKRGAVRVHRSVHRYPPRGAGTPAEGRRRPEEGGERPPSRRSRINKM